MFSHHFSGRERGFNINEGSLNGGLRWRSDESSDEEGEHTVERAVGVTSFTTPEEELGGVDFLKDEDCLAAILYTIDSCNYP